MIGGRIVSGVANAVLLGVSGKSYGFTVFITGSIVTALPGIIAQIVVIPLLIIALQRAKLTSRALRN
jgi:type IV secretory pathway VirB3-like protein